jgi:hypothetical protein
MHVLFSLDLEIWQGVIKKTINLEVADQDLLLFSAARVVCSLYYCESFLQTDYLYNRKNQMLVYGDSDFSWTEDQRIYSHYNLS